MTRTFLVIALCHAMHSGSVAQARPAIIPFPTSWTSSPGIFSVNASTRIYHNENCTAEVNFFVDWLNAASGGNFKASMLDGSDIPPENIIIFNCGPEQDFETAKLALALSPMKNIDASMIRDAGEDYQLVINPRAIVVNASEPQGVFHSIQTLRQLFPPEAEAGKVKLPLPLQCMQIRDEPLFRHRGLLLDCCRHFMQKQFVLRYLDLLAYYKMNVLHWHLTEDQGWRIEIDKYPLLTETGAWRTEKDGTRYGGFYTKDDIREIVAYAQDRHITIIPEIELPGHCSAAIASYPALSCTGEKMEVENEWGVFKDIYCAGNDAAFSFLEDVLTEVCDLFPSAYIHIGGDEAPKYRWQHCDKCQKRMREESLESEAELQTYFIERIAEFLKTKGKKIIGWDEILEGGIPANAAVQSWRGMDGGKNAALAKHEVVMSPTSHCYFDYGLAAIDLEKVYSFDPIPAGLDSRQASYIIGGECNMWSEHAPQEKVDSKVFPRLLALSEVLWTYPQNRDYVEFYKRVEEHYNLLDAMTVEYGMPSVPVEIISYNTDDGKTRIALNANFPGMVFLYESRLLDYPGNQSITSAASQAWSKPTNYSEPFDMTGYNELRITPTWRGKQHEEETITAKFWTHAGTGKNLTLNYAPSPNYTGGGNLALLDGRLGSENFRDGIWQAVQGKNMEATIDFGLQESFSSVSLNFFHYENAWIFRPSKIEIMTSDDGLSWQTLAVTAATLDEKTQGELIVPYISTFAVVETRFLKVVAHNNGPCPPWHDAPGEPSWLFCDEIVVR